jgi:hypothetical protein
MSVVANLNLDALLVTRKATLRFAARNERMAILLEPSSDNPISGTSAATMWPSQDPTVRSR